MYSNMIKKRVQNKVLGELETEIMDIVWLHKKAISVKEVAETIRKKRKIAYTTAMTIMARLVNKGVLVRRLQGVSYLYKPKVSKDQFLAKTVHGIFSSVVSTLGEEVLTHFIKEIENIDPEKRRQLLKSLDK